MDYISKQLLKLINECNKIKIYVGLLKTTTLLYSLLLKVYKLQENEEENSNSSSTGSFTSPEIYLSEKGIRGKELLKIYPKILKETIYRHVKRPLADKTVDKRKHNHDRSRKNLPWDKRLIFSQIPILRQQNESFTIKRLRVSARVRKGVSDETVSGVLHGAGYRSLHSRKKALFKKDNFEKRRKFARKFYPNVD